MLSLRRLTGLTWVKSTAISTLAGTLLVSNCAAVAVIDDVVAVSPRPRTALFWATATWWIPLLIALGVCVIACLVPLAYDVVYWMLFLPWACTQYARIVYYHELHWLDVVPKYFVFVALSGE